MYFITLLLKKNKCINFALLQFIFFLQTLRKLKIINMFFFHQKINFIHKTTCNMTSFFSNLFSCIQVGKNPIKADDIFISSRKRSIYRLNSGCQNFNRWTVTNLIKGAVDSDLDLHNLSRYCT